MKHFYTLLILCLPLLTSAQKTEGTVYYKESMTIELEPEQEQFRAMIEKGTTSYTELLFTKNTSLYRAHEEEEVDDPSQDGEMQIQMISNRDESIVYTTLDDMKQVEQSTFMGKKFLIKGDVEKRAWKITNEKKKILDYTCTKATFTDSTSTIEVWFTTDIPIAVGPISPGQLPGMILEVVIGGQFTITATKVEFAAPDKKAMKAPKQGKEISREDYDVLVAEKLKEMDAERGGGGGGGAHIEIRID